MLRLSCAPWTLAVLLGEDGPLQRRGAQNHRARHMQLLHWHKATAGQRGHGRVRTNGWFFPRAHLFATCNKPPQTIRVEHRPRAAPLEHRDATLNKNERPHIAGMKVTKSSIARNRSSAFFATDSHPSQRFHRANFSRLDSLGRPKTCGSGRLPFQNTFHSTLLSSPRMLGISHVASSNPATNMDGQADPSAAQLAHSNDVTLHAKTHPTECQMEGPYLAQWAGCSSSFQSPQSQCVLVVCVCAQ